MDLTPSNPHAVAIVGLGPKGFYGLERLIAEFHARPLRRRLEIHVFNRTAKFGASPIYDPDQPEYILVNLSVGEIDLWTAEDPPICAGRGPNFVDWYHAKFQPEKPLIGNEYLSRAVVGRYLVEGFERILAHLPSGVTVSRHIGEVVDLRPVGRHYQIEWRNAHGHREIVCVDKALLATGHSRLLLDTDQARYQAFSLRAPRATYIPFVYPIVETMGQVAADSRVALQGLGLTFLDAVLGITEGRGGRFERSTTGELTYRRSGHEPRAIFPFSRTGLPMAPKAADLDEGRATDLRFLTETALADLKRRSSSGQLDLYRDIWPLFEQELDFHYYRVAMGDEARTRLEACGDDAQAMQGVIEEFLAAHPQVARFDLRRELDPVAGRRFASGEQFASFVVRMMEREIGRARQGQGGCGAKAALGIWYDVRRVLGSALSFGGLTAQAQRDLIEIHYPRLKRVAFGPPILNIEKLLALARAGLVDFSVARGPQVDLDEESGQFELRCREIPGAVARADVLVDARFPPTDVERDETPLYRRLRERGMVRAYENRSNGEKGFEYRSGAIDMTPGSRFVVDHAGVGNRDLAVIGIPTEGNLVGNLTVTWDAYAAVWATEVLAQLRRAEPP